MIKERRLANHLQQIRPRVAARNMRELMCENRFQLGMDEIR